MSDSSNEGDRSFESILEELQANPTLLEAARSQSTGMAGTFAQAFATRAVRRPRSPPSQMPISERAEKLIVLCEITSEAAYERRYRYPIRPGGQSGITIGVGYDLGCVTAEWLEEDWGHHVTLEVLGRLRPACGLRGASAQARLSEFRNIEIPWSSAWPQFRTMTLPRFVGETNAFLPNCDQLSPDCLGALSSLTLNRGPSYTTNKPRYTEMRNIRKHMGVGALEQIPGEILAMRRLWTGKNELRGVVLRREAEARLFKDGLD
jgi:hypothetical protein